MSIKLYTHYSDKKCCWVRQKKKKKLHELIKHTGVDSFQ